MRNTSIGQVKHGGWKVLRERTDKKANAAHVARNILKTINRPVLKENLIDSIEHLTPEDFNDCN
jgi:hypothetical protein